MKSQTTKILVIDDHPIFIEGLKLVLSLSNEDMEIISSDNVSEWLKDLKSLLKYDLVLVDLNLPGNNGFSLLDASRIHKINTPISVISGSERFVDVQKAISKGAQGFIFKSEDSHSLFKAISTLLNGGVFVPKKFEDDINFLIKEDGSKQSTKLTKRQYQVLRMIDDGMTNSEIADVLNVSLSTVKSHIDNLFRELNVHNRTSCLKAAREQEIDF